MKLFIIHTAKGRPNVVKPTTKPGKRVEQSRVEEQQIEWSEQHDERKHPEDEDRIAEGSRRRKRARDSA